MSGEFGNEKIAQSKIHLNLITFTKPFHRRSLVGYMNSIEDPYFCLIPKTMHLRRRKGNNMIIIWVNTG